MKRLPIIHSVKILAAIVILLIAGLGYHLVKKPTIIATYPEYFSFSGNYVFPVLSGTQVDLESVPGLELIYSGKISAKTLDDIYGVAGISLQPITSLTDHSGKAFKAYVSGTLVPQLKTNLSTSDVRLIFDKSSGWDIAKVFVIKNDTQLRFIYLKNGQHPVAVVAKEETDAVKKIETSVVDVEQSDLKKEVDPIKQTLKTTAQLVKDQNVHALYQAAAPELRANSTEQEMTSSFNTSTSYIKGEMTVNGISYSPGEFSAVLIFSSSGAKDSPRAYSTLNFKKTNGGWKLKGLTLPTIASPAAQKL